MSLSDRQRPEGFQLSVVSAVLAAVAVSLTPTVSETDW